MWAAIIKYSLGPLIRDGVVVNNAHTGTDELVKLQVAWRVEDSKGIASAIGCSQFPAYNGSCCQCSVTGIRVYKTTNYPGAVCLLPDGHPLRDEFREVYANHDEMKALADAVAPRPWGLKQVMRLGRQVERGEKDASDTGWKFEDELTTGLAPEEGRWWNKITRTVLDPGHQLHNFVKDAIYLTGNLKKMKFSKGRRLGENKLGRFIMRKRQRKPFHASTNCQARINHLCVTLKMPAGWPALNPLFRDCSKFKIAESLALCGDRGKYLFQFLDIDERIRKELIQALHIFGELLQKVSNVPACFMFLING